MRIDSFINKFKPFFKRIKILGYLPEILICLFCIYMLTMKAEVVENRTSDHLGDTIWFSGYQWIVKDSYGKQTGPGNNYFSGSRENVYVDQDGKLHLRLTNRDDKWYCPEVKMINSLGYGRYYFYLDTLPQPLDKDIVIGLFLYDREDTNNFHKEIDIEFSQWGKDSTMNSQYVIQPKEINAHRFQTDFKKNTIHIIELRRKKIGFESSYKKGKVEKGPLQIAKSKFTPDYEYFTNKETISINVWLYHTVEPSNLKEFEVVISRFEFKQFWYDGIFKSNSNKKKQ